MSAPEGVVSLLNLGSVLRTSQSLLRAKFERAGLEARLLRLPSGTMRCFVGGRAGRALLLLHGFGGGALQSWHKQVRAFSAHFRLIVPDLYWFGESVPRLDLLMDRPSDHADAIAELLDQLKVQRVHLLGVSFGGFVALQLARRHGQRLRKLVLANAAGLQLTSEEQRLAATSFGGARDLEHVLIPRDVEALRRFLCTVFYRPPFVPRFVLEQLLRDEFWLNAEAKRRLCAGIVSELLEVEDLAAVRCETMLIWGRHDPLLLPTVGRRMQLALPRARFVVLEHCAHPSMLEQPKRFNDEVLHFLRAPRDTPYPGMARLDWRRVLMARDV